MKEREQRKQQHVLEQMATPKKADAVEQNAESVPDDEQFCKVPREGAGFMDNQSGPGACREWIFFNVLMNNWFGLF